MSGEFIGTGAAGNGCRPELGWYPKNGDAIERFVKKIGKLNNKVERRKL